MGMDVRRSIIGVRQRFTASEGTNIDRAQMMYRKRLGRTEETGLKRSRKRRREFGA